MSGNSPRRVLFASLIGTTIEFYDFYIYATAAVLVFPKLFFPSSDPGAATLQSLATFALALLACAALTHFAHHLLDPACAEERAQGSSHCATCSALHGAALTADAITVAGSAPASPHLLHAPLRAPFAEPVPTRCAPRAPPLA